MRKLLTAGIFGTILSLTGANYAGASIISRGFFDEAMENYATNTALDLKANQSDLVNLSNIVGTPTELTYRDILRNSNYIDLIMGSDYQDTYGDNTFPTNDISELINLNYTDSDFPGLAGVVDSLFVQRDRNDQWPLRLSDIFNDYEYLSNSGNYSFYELIINGGTVSERDNNVTVYGLKDLTTKIGTLPESAYLPYDPDNEFTLPETIGEQLELIFSAKNINYCIDHNTPIYSIPRISKFLEYIIYGTPIENKGMFLDCGTWINFRNLQELTSDIDTINANIGTLPDGKTVTDMINTINTNIGTLPDGKTVTGMINTINANIGTLPDGKTVTGLVDEIKTKIGTVPFGNLTDMIIETDAKIGDLPTEYTTVGAALFKMGLDINKKNLPSTSVDGQYVLTAKKVGDKITYTWVKMDLTNEEQAQ